MEEVVAPVFQTKLLPPEAVSVVLCPEHNNMLPLMEAVMPGTIVTVAATVLLPQIFVTTAEYVDVAVGLTTIEAVVWPPGDQE